VIRRALTAAFSAEPLFDVVASASNGRIALMKMPLLRPDVVVLDVEMPELDGIQTLAAIRQTHPRLPVIMLNVPTPQGAAATVDALLHGATDHVMKPDMAVPSDDALKLLGDELLAKVAVWCPADPGALMDLIPGFANDFPVPIVIVQHMPPKFTKLLAERLAARSRIAVVEGQLSDALVPGGAQIAPGDFHMAVARDGEAVRLVTHRQPPENSCRPAVDVLFRSVAEVYGSHVLAVVMTGMGRDGLRGCAEIQVAGGQILVQDEASSVVWGMPGFVTRAGLADKVVPLDQLGAEIIGRVYSHVRTACVAV
jgi:two-component system chemotaxis response regulator CheB